MLGVLAEMKCYDVVPRLGCCVYTLFYFTLLYMVFFSSAVSVSPELSGLYCVFNITFTCCRVFFSSFFVCFCGEVIMFFMCRMFWL